MRLKQDEASCLVYLAPDHPNVVPKNTACFCGSLGRFLRRFVAK